MSNYFDELEERQLFIVRRLRRRLYEQVCKYNRPKRFCLFLIKAKDTDRYNRFEKVLLALRIGRINIAWDMMCGKNNWIFEGFESNPLPF